MPKVNFSVVKKQFLPLLLLLLSYSITLADSALEYAVKSAVALNFARFTEWPTATSSSVNFCTLADPSIQQAFMVIDKKALGDKNLAVIKLEKINDLADCQLLYVAEGYSNQIKQVRNETIQRHILTIGETEDFLENGGMVNLDMEEGKIKLQVNLNLVQQAKLQISARVLKLATIVNF